MSGQTSGSHLRQRHPRFAASIVDVGPVRARTRDRRDAHVLTLNQRANDPSGFTAEGAAQGDARLQHREQASDPEALSARV